MDEHGLDAYLHRLGLVLDQPLDGLAAITELRGTIDRIEGLLVALARSNGATWMEIGEALGVSRQTAHYRHGHLSGRPNRDSPCPWA